MEDSEHGFSTPLLSICIVTGRRDATLDACLASLAAQRDAPPFELLVCADGDPAVADAVHAWFPGAVVCYVDHALPGAARNLLVERARGELLVFLDDDVTLDPHLLARYGALATSQPDTGVFGGPNDTPSGSTAFQAAQGAALASIVGSGPVRRRYGAHPAGFADERFFILCNLAVRRSVMVPFSSSLVCAEENEVLAELRRSGVRMYYDPALVAYHERRASWGGFARQMFKYGRGRGQLVVRRPLDSRPSHLAPSAMLGYLSLVPFMRAIFGAIVLLPLTLYLMAVAACAAWIGSTLRRARAVPQSFALILVLHAGYGAGVLRGILSSGAAVPAPKSRAWLGPAEPEVVIDLTRHAARGTRATVGEPVESPAR